MAAEDNLSHQLFFEAHRGVKLHSGNNFNLDKNNLGMHWTLDPNVAHIFGGVKSVPETGHVLHARIPIGSFETNTDALRRKAVSITNIGTGLEKEIPVSKGSSVLVTGSSKFRRDTKQDAPKNQLLKEGVGRDTYYKERKRTYNPPREMIA